MIIMSEINLKEWEGSKKKSLDISNFFRGSNEKQPRYLNLLSAPFLVLQVYSQSLILGSLLLRSKQPATAAAAAAAAAITPTSDELLDELQRQRYPFITAFSWISLPSHG